MITYRNPLWNITIKYLEELEKCDYFKETFNGKFLKRIKLINEEALSKMHISGNNWKLFLEVLSFITEKDITDEMREVFEEAAILGLQCSTFSEGESIYKIAQEALKERKIKEETAKKLKKAKELYDEKMEKHRAYIEVQTKTQQELEEAKRLLEEAERSAEELNSDNNSNSSIIE